MKRTKRKIKCSVIHFFRLHYFNLGDFFFFFLGEGLKNADVITNCANRTAFFSPCNLSSILEKKKKKLIPGKTSLRRHTELFFFKFTKSPKGKEKRRSSVCVF